VHVSSLRSRW